MENDKTPKNKIFDQLNDYFERKGPKNSFADFSKKLRKENGCNKKVYSGSKNKE